MTSSAPGGGRGVRMGVVYAKVSEGGCGGCKLSEGGRGGCELSEGGCGGVNRMRMGVVDVN